MHTRIYTDFPQTKRNTYRHTLSTRPLPFSSFLFLFSFYSINSGRTRNRWLCSDGSLSLFAHSCPSNLIFDQLSYTVKDNNVEAASTVAAIDANKVQLKCIGPDLVIGQFGPQKEKFAKLEGTPDFTQYVPTNYTAWRAANEFNYDNLKRASVVMFTFFYKTSWVQFSEATTQSTSVAVAILFIVIILVVAYYLLNLTVGIMCLNFSESIKMESGDDSGGGDDEPEDDDEEEEEEEDDDDEDVVEVCCCC